MNQLSDRVLKLIDAALDLQQAQEFEQAIDTLMKAAESAPNYAPIYLLLGLNYQQLQRLDDAETNLRKALTLDPNYGEALQALGLMLAAREDWPEAIAFLKAHWLQDPGNPETLDGLSTALLRSGRLEEAVHTLKSAWEQTHEREPGVLYGRFLIQVGRLPEAEVALREVAEICLCPQTLSELALALLLLNRNEEAAEVLGRATKLDPDFDRAWRGLAGCYDRLGDHQRALEAAGQALRLNPKHYRNWMAQANALLGLRRFEDVATSARKGIDLINPEDEEAHPVLQQLLQQLCQALLATGKIEEALQQLDAARRLFPLEESFPYIEVSVLADFDRYAEALQVLNEAFDAGIPRDHSLAPLHYRVLHCLDRPNEAWQAIRPQLNEDREFRIDLLADIGFEVYAQGKIDCARAIFEQLSEFAPDISRLQSNLAFILIGDGNIARAEAYLQQVLDAQSASKFDAIALSNLGYLQLLQGHIDEAQQIFERALQTVENPDDSAILRVAYCRAGQIMPEFFPYPLHSAPIPLSIQANLSTARLARGDTAGAESLARRIIEAAPGLGLGFKVLGWALIAQARREEARLIWQQALTQIEDDESYKAIQHWLNTELR